VIDLMLLCIARAPFDDSEEKRDEQRDDEGELHGDGTTIAWCTHGVSAHV
jgi:hypothetical protein